VFYNPADDSFTLPADHAMVLANEDIPVFLAGALRAIACAYTDQQLVVGGGAREVGLSLGAQADERRLSSVLRKAGFSRVRRD
jgi:hypothetical protein